MRLRTTTEIPQTILPMLATSGEVFDSAEWAYELKWSGVRCLAFARGGRIELQTRNLNWVQPQFPELAELAALPDGTVIDGELVVLEEGVPSLGAVQRRLKYGRAAVVQELARNKPATFIAFDCIYAGGERLAELPYRARRPITEMMLCTLGFPLASTTASFIGLGPGLLHSARAAGLEGVMAKHLDKPYLPGKRSRWWMKIRSKESGG